MTAAVRTRNFFTPPLPLTDGEIRECGRQVVAAEARAVADMIARIDASFVELVQRLLALHGSVIVTGMGKAGLIGQKLAATFASTGTRAHYLHPAEAFHGDLGRIHRDDLVLALSQSGETAEVVQLLTPLRRAGVGLAAITAVADSTLGRAADIALTIGKLEEACQHGLAPSTSTTAMLAIGDAIALVASRLRGFREEDFARFHPGGSLGRQLSAVEDHMRPLVACRTAYARQSVREVLATASRPGRRSGAVMLLDAADRLAGLFTDSDLARLVERCSEQALDRPVCDVMTAHPVVVTVGAPLADAIELLAERKFSELPVVDDEHRPVGMIDVTDVIEIPSDAVEAPDDYRRSQEAVVGNPSLRVFDDDAGDSSRAPQAPAIPRREQP